ncbi:response regulator [Silvanigrella sp.]|jgi:signal transduction histidine kinase/CheY-like chemotaxis protein|uniref:response regulator n=1 Tax=Silvanigrella sp. TaxID=2024976 RepID=UPI0037C5DCB8
MIHIRNIYWKLPFFLVSKKSLSILLILSILIMYYNKNIIDYKLLLTFYCTSAWIITATYLLFKLVYISGINQYLLYSKIIAIYAILSWIEISILLINDPTLIKITPFIQKIPLLAFYIYIVIYKYRYRMKVNRMEPWITGIYYLTIPYLILSIYNYFIPNNAGKFVEVFTLFYIDLIAFSHAISVSLKEYLRLGNLQDDMEKRNIEILQFAQKAKESTRMKGEFLANMSHELRTPLNGILGSATLLIGTKLNQEQRNYLETLRICGNNLLVIINEILDYSKIEANKLELEHIPFEINSCIENVFELLAPAAAAQETDLIYFIDYDVPKLIVSDYTRVQQVLTHLVDNAIKFTNKGHALVKVSNEKTEKGKFLIKFEIIDTGRGISRKDINKLFKSFSQIDDSSTRKYGGTGLGLSIAKRLTELMGGFIGVKSESGKGSTFTFTVAVDYEEAEKLSLEKDKDNESKMLQLKNKIAFIVEKNPIQLEAIRQKLEKWGLEAYTASSHLETIEIPSQVPPNFVIISIDDFEYEKIRTELISKYMDQTIIFLAILKNSSIYYSEEKFLPKGFASAINKPIRLSQILESLIDTSTAKQKGSIAGIKLDQSKVSDLFPLRILVAEDNVVNQKLITNMLKKFGYLCDIVANGNEVLEALTRNQYDIILMDVQMPDLDGIEATKRIVIKYPKSASRPHVIAMTAHARGAEGQVCLDAGMEGYLGKPIDMKELKQVLEFWGNKVNKLKSTA